MALALFPIVRTDTRPGALPSPKRKRRYFKKRSCNPSGLQDIFIIGGSLGLTQELLSKCNFRICFSKMTFPHQLIRVFLLEQIFRAFKISHGETYHR